MGGKIVLLFLIVLVAIVAAALTVDYYYQSGRVKKIIYDGPIKKQIIMELTSPVFINNEQIPVKYGCDGEDVNPPLTIIGTPEKAKSLALIVDDPDAPTGDWVHWVLWNIPPQTKQIAENSVPSGAKQGINDFGNLKWGGPCPPNGLHHYYFRLYALDTILNLPDGAGKKELLKAMEGHVLERAELVGLYER